eukprot:869141-Rhodomonas_salina.3
MAGAQVKLMKSEFMRTQVASLPSVLPARYSLSGTDIHQPPTPCPVLTTPCPHEQQLHAAGEGGPGGGGPGSATSPGLAPMDGPDIGSD